MKDTQEVLTQSANETKIIASNMSKDIKMNSVIALYGDIGTGKTTFTQGFALGLGVNEHVTSPTFKLVSEYSGDSKKLYHIDCYRMKGCSDFLNIGGELFQAAVCSGPRSRTRDNVPALRHAKNTN